MIVAKSYNIFEPLVSLLVEEYYVYLVGVSVELRICEEPRKVSNQNYFIKPQQHAFQNINSIQILDKNNSLMSILKSYSK